MLVVVIEQLLNFGKDYPIINIEQKNNKIMIHIKSKKEHYQFLIICTLIKASIFFKIIPDRILHISIKQILITK